MIGRDVIDYDRGKDIENNQPVFWGNVIMVIAKNRNNIHDA